MALAFRAGLHPNEFWDLAPCEVLAFISAQTRRRLEEAWAIAWLQRIDADKFPKRASDLFPGSDGDKPMSAESVARVLNKVFAAKKGG